MSTTTSKLGLILPDPTELMAPGAAFTPPAINTNFTTIDGVVGPTICTSSTRPGSPRDMQMIYETDTLATRIWDSVAAAWYPLSKDSYWRLAAYDQGSIAGNVSITPANGGGTEVIVSSFSFTQQPTGNNYAFRCWWRLKSSTAVNGNADNAKLTVRRDTVAISLTSPAVAITKQSVDTYYANSAAAVMFCQGELASVAVPTTIYIGASISIDGSTTSSSWTSNSSNLDCQLRVYAQ